MGLGITVGMLYSMARNDAEGFSHYEVAFAGLSEALAEEGVSWREPSASATGSELHSGSFPYSYLAHLRRAFVLEAWGEPVTPALSVSKEQYGRDLDKVDDEMTMFSSHLLCHSDAEGYYIPVDFSEPLFLPPEAKVAGGGMVGSSQRLAAELRRLAPAIGIDLGPDGSLSDQESSRLSEVLPDALFGTEQYAWRQLYLACLASASSGHAVVFC